MEAHQRLPNISRLTLFRHDSCGKVERHGFRMHSCGARGRASAQSNAKVRREGDLDRPPSHTTNRTIRLYFSMIIFRDSVKPAAAMR